MPKFHEIQRLAFEGPTLVLEVDGQSYRLSVAAVSPRLAAATEAQRNFFRISASGYGVHWPALDEDLAVDGLIRAAGGVPTTNAYQTGPMSPASVLNDKPS